MSVWRNSALIAALTLFSSGCGGSDLVLPPPAPATGTVTLDGKPLVNATVFFSPDGQKMGKGSSGTTDAEGKFKLTTLIDGVPQEGAIPGKYRVYFSQLIGPDKKPIVPSPDKQPADLDALEGLPAHLSDFQQSTETAEIGESGGTFDFKLSARPGGMGPGGLMPK